MLPFELNLRSKRWLDLTVYKPPAQNSTYFREQFSRVVHFYSSSYDSLMVIGDFYLEEKGSVVRCMMNDHNFSSLIKHQPASYRVKAGVSPFISCF